MRKSQSSRPRNSTRRIGRLAAVLLIAFLSACAGGKKLSWVAHCETSDERPDAELVDDEWVMVNDLEPRPDHFLDYVDDLESGCLGINKGRGDAMPPGW